MNAENLKLMNNQWSVIYSNSSTPLYNRNGPGDNLVAKKDFVLKENTDFEPEIIKMNSISNRTAELSVNLNNQQVRFQTFYAWFQILRFVSIFKNRFTNSYVHFY